LFVRARPCARNGLPEEALECSIAAGDADTAAELVQRLWLPALRQSRVVTVQRWSGWLEERGVIGEHPMAAVGACLIAVVTGRPAEAERGADLIDRWQQNPARPVDPAAEAFAVLLRTFLCRHGAGQMRSDADAAAHRFTELGAMLPVIPLLQGLTASLAGPSAPDPETDALVQVAVRSGIGGREHSRLGGSATHGRAWPLPHVLGRCRGRR
jgi:hypothetical protein